MRSGTGCRLGAGGALPQAGEHVGGIGFEARAEAIGRKLLGNGDRAGRGIERVERRLGGIGLDLAFAQPGKGGLGFCEGAFENRGGLDAAATRDPNRLRRPGDPSPPLEVREPHLLL
jgi:hypothetical protein